MKKSVLVGVGALLCAYLASGLIAALIGVNYRVFVDPFNPAYLAADLILWVLSFVISFLMLNSLPGVSSGTPAESKEVPKAWTQLLVKQKEGEDGWGEEESN